MSTRTARCACGQLSARCFGEPAKVSLCHCLQCQRRTGSAFGIAAFFPMEDVEVIGATSTWSRASDSGHAVTFQFCPTCGSTVLWRPSRLPQLVAVAAGAFGDPDFPAPEQAVYLHHRHRWLKD